MITHAQATTIYNDTLADSLRIKEKPFKKPEWKHYLAQIA